MKLKTFMIWYTDVIFELIFLTKRSNHKCVPITFTKLTNVTNVENYLLMLVIWEDTSNCSWRLQKFQMWILWKIIYSSWFSEQTHRNYSFRSQRFQVWLLRKIFPYVVIWKDTSNLFMKVAKISNVNLVKNHLLKLVL